ncbi:MAG: adenosylmethionine-8-amino-7-oxononanoate aminotransferase [Porticoccus sp.]|jgi:adenosylmethionine-8-amino-7-oxononanoate aminotransferase
MTLSTEQLLQLDQQHIWHPYASQINPPPAYPVVSASGVRLQLADGRQLIDGMSSWWCAIHGYNNPILNTAAKDQIDKMSHVMFGGITHPPAVELAKKLVDLTPAPLTKVFLSDSGSVAVEVAIKMALQYWLSGGASSKTRLLTVRGGYHGDTFAAMGVCDPVTGMHHLFKDVLSDNIFAPMPPTGYDRPFEAQDLAEFETLLVNNKDEIAAVILEPIVQGAGGVRFYSPDYLKHIRVLCDKYNVLLILDEIATGFGRTGELFGCHHADISPDIMCLGKAITGGYVTLAATLCSDKVAIGISEGEASVFMHGPTFMGNPLACAIANASIDLLIASDWQAKVKNIEKILIEELAPARELEHVADVRVLGAIGVIELHKAVDMAAIQKQFVDAGIWIRPFGKLVYTMPPFIINDEDLRFLAGKMHSVVAELN